MNDFAASLVIRFGVGLSSCLGAATLGAVFAGVMLMVIEKLSGKDLSPIRDTVHGIAFVVAGFAAAIVLDRLLIVIRRD